MLATCSCRPVSDVSHVSAPAVTTVPNNELSLANRRCPNGALRSATERSLRGRSCRTPERAASPSPLGFRLALPTVLSAPSNGARDAGAVEQLEKPLVALPRIVPPPFGL